MSFIILTTGDNIREFSNTVIPKTQTHYVFTNLSLENGQRYFASVRAYNKAGLHTTISSDGFIVDTESPRPGVAYDGKGKNSCSLGIPKMFALLQNASSALNEYDGMLKAIRI